MALALTSGKSFIFLVQKEKEVFLLQLDSVKPVPSFSPLTDQDTPQDRQGFPGSHQRCVTLPPREQGHWLGLSFSLL